MWNHFSARSGELPSLQVPQSCQSTFSPQSCRRHREALGFRLTHCDRVSFEGNQEFFRVLNTISDCGNQTWVGWVMRLGLSPTELWNLYTESAQIRRARSPRGQRYPPSKAAETEVGPWEHSSGRPLAFEHWQPKLRGGARSLCLVMKCSQLSVFTLFL